MHISLKHGLAVSRVCYTTLWGIWESVIKTAVFPDVSEQINTAQYSRQYSTDTHSDDHRRITDRDLQTHSSIILKHTHTHTHMQKT